jgi:hypothetical protein
MSTVWKVKPNMENEWIAKLANMTCGLWGIEYHFHDYLSDILEEESFKTALEKIDKPIHEIRELLGKELMAQVNSLPPKKRNELTWNIPGGWQEYSQTWEKLRVKFLRMLIDPNSGGRIDSDLIAALSCLALVVCGSLFFKKK